VLLSTLAGKMQRAGPFGVVKVREKTCNEEVILYFLAASLFLSRVSSGSHGKRKPGASDLQPLLFTQRRIGNGFAWFLCAFLFPSVDPDDKSMTKKDCNVHVSVTSDHYT